MLGVARRSASLGIARRRSASLGVTRRHSASLGVTRRRSASRSGLGVARHRCLASLGVACSCTVRTCRALRLFDFSGVLALVGLFVVFGFSTFRVFLHISNFWAFRLHRCSFRVLGPKVLTILRCLRPSGVCFSDPWRVPLTVLTRYSMWRFIGHYIAFFS